MSGYRHLLIILCALFLSASIVSAKVYWLPDYLGDNNDRSNVSEKDTDKDGIVSGNEGSNRGCPNGWLSSSEKGDKICVAKGSFPWIGTCYGDCVCDTSKYQYTSANCFGTKAPSGKDCEENGTIYYEQCIDACDTVEDKTINPDWGCIKKYDSCPLECEIPYSNNCHNISGTPIDVCPYGCKISYENEGCDSECQECYADNCHITQGSPLTDCKYECKTTYEAEGCATECKECYPDKCHTLTNKEPCPYGCEIEFTMAVDECDTGCKQCYENNCLNRTDNATGLGCDKYWQDCPSKCEVGKTCVPNDCAGFTLSSCPANASCSNCSAGCGDSTKKYKLDSCNTGYEANEDKTECVCKPKDCSEYTESSCPEGHICSSCVVGCGDNTKKYKITCTPQNCHNKGYTLSSCPSGKVCVACQNGCGDNDYHYKVSDNGAIVLTVKQNNRFVSFLSSWSSKGNQPLTADFHDGRGPVLFSSGGDWISDDYVNNHDDDTTKQKVTLTGELTYAFMSNILEIESLDMKSLGTIKFPCDSDYYNPDLTGEIPEFPPNLINADGMFRECKGLTGTIPNLPSKLESATGMFKGCKNLTGFADDFEYPQTLTETTSMFEGSGLSGKISKLPKNLTSVLYMFKDCSGLTGFADDFEFPATLTNASYMFYGCTNLTGNVPELPNNLTIGNGMFYKCSGLEMFAEGFNFPNSLTEADYMFQGCTNLEGELPELPNNLTSYRDMFKGTKIPKDSSWPADAW